MKKKLIFCICIVLTIIMCISAVPISANIYHTTVEITSAAALVVNLDTNTVVYEKNSTKSRYQSYLCNIMTYIIVYNNVHDIDKEIEIKEEVLNMVTNSDNTLRPYVGKTLSIKDLLHVLMMTNGTEAAYVLADYVTNGDIPAFVELMNKKAAALGCTKTKFSSVEAVFDTSQVTTCSDMFKIVNSALSTSYYHEVSSKATYIPQKYKETHTPFKNTNSMSNPQSPYYFKHVKSGKYGQDSVARANIVVTTEYNDTNYVCIIMGASNDSEHNAFTEAKQILSWAYKKLGDKQVLNKDSILKTTSAKSPWGEACVELTAGKDITRTVPVDYTSDKVTIEFDETYTAIAPIFVGQNMGTAKLYYDGTFFEEINLVSKSSVGISMYSDLSGFFGAMVESTLSE